MANNYNASREMHDYLQSMWYQNMANKGSNSYSAGVIPRAQAPPAGWMAMMGGVPSTAHQGRGVVGVKYAPRPAFASPAEERAAKRAYNKMMAEKNGGGGTNKFDPQNFMPPQSGGGSMPVPYFSPDQYMQQQSYMQPQAPPEVQGYTHPFYQQQQQPVQPQGPTLYEQLAQSYLDQTNAANAKNEERYDQGLGLALGLRDRNMERIEQLGTQQAADIRRDYDRAGKAEYANLVGRGLAGSTVAGAVQRRVLDEQTQNLNRLEDYLARQRIDTDANLTKNAQDFIERRNDVAPDMSMLVNLAQGLGQGNNGQGFGYLPQTQGLYSTGNQNMSLAYGQNQPPVLRPPTGSGMGYGNDFRGGTTPILPGFTQQPANRQLQNPGFNSNVTQPQYGAGNPLNNPSWGGYQAYGGMGSGSTNYNGPGSGISYGGYGLDGGYGAGNPLNNPVWGGYQAYSGPGTVGNVGGRQIVQGGPKPIDYAAAKQYELQRLTPQPQQRYMPNYGGGGYGGYRPLQTLPAPQFTTAGSMGYAVPMARYGMNFGGAGPISGYSNYLGRRQQQPGQIPQRNMARPRPMTNQNQMLTNYGPYIV